MGGDPCAFPSSLPHSPLPSPRHLAQRKAKAPLAELSSAARQEQLWVARSVRSSALGPARLWAERCIATATITGTIGTTGIIIIITDTRTLERGGLRKRSSSAASRRRAAFAREGRFE